MKKNKLQLISLIYHDYFDYPLTKKELTRWQSSVNISLPNYQLPATSCQKGFYFLQGRHELVQLRQEREKYSLKKLRLAKKAAKLLSFIPTILFIGITGSLAMNNAKKSSDIDLMIITKQGTLWSTRFAAYVILYMLYALGYKNLSLRKPQSKLEKNKLCLNIWLDESDLVITEQNIYTAHELSQIVPLVNKGETYERLLSVNKWTLSFWPKAVQIPPTRPTKTWRSGVSLITPIEKLFFWLQLLYMKPKLTREVVTPTHAFFHPNNLSPKILKYLKQKRLLFYIPNILVS